MTRRPGVKFGAWNGGRVAQHALAVGEDLLDWVEVEHVKATGRSGRRLPHEWPAADLDSSRKPLIPLEFIAQPD